MAGSKASKVKYHVQGKYAWMLRFIDTIGASIRRDKSSFDRESMRNIKRIAVIRLDHIGDLLLSTPVFAALKKRFPDADVTAIVRPLTSPIIKHNKDIDAIEEVSPPWFSRGKKAEQGFLSFLRKRRRHYDLVVELHADPRNIMLARIIGKYCIGYDVRGLGFLLDGIAVYEKGKKHIILRHQDVLKAIGISGSSTKLSMPYPRNLAKAILKSNPFMKNKFIIIHPGTGRPIKEWPLAKWKQLAELLENKYIKYHIVITGSTADMPAAESIRDACPDKSRMHVLAGKLDLLELAAAIDKAELLIGPDTGPIHMAYALGTPSIALFGPEDPDVWGYNRGKNISFRKLSVTPEEIIRAIKAIGI